MPTGEKKTRAKMSQTLPLKARRYPCKWEDCSLIFDEEIQVYEHVASQHNKSGKSLCKWRELVGGPFCNALFKHRNMLREHAVAHFTNQLKPFQCPRCNEFFRSVKGLREHDRFVHIFSAAATLIPESTRFGKIGDSALLYERIIEDMRVSNHQVPASFLRLFEKMKFDGSRVNNFIQYDPEISELKLKHYNYIQHINGNPLKPEMAIKINETCLEILKPAFDQLQSNKSTTRKASLNYRALAINLLKLFHTYLHKYINDDISFLIESKIVYPFGNRIGLIYNIPYEFNTREQLARLEAIRILVFHFERNCQKYADSIGGEDGLKFSCFEGRQGAMVYLVIWVTACNRNLFRNVVAPKSGDLYRMLGFSF